MTFSKPSSRAILRDNRKSERGNALFLILIAVALFAALSYAVTQSGRSGAGGTSKESGALNAGQLTDYGASVRTAVTRMVLTGPATTATLDFITATDSSNAVFTTPLGGGVVAVAPPSAAVAGGALSVGAAAANAAWRYKTLGTSGGAGGWYVAGIGTNTTDSGRDAFAFIGVTQSACTSINTGLAVTIAFPTTPTVFTSASGEGTAAQIGGAAAGGAEGGNAYTIDSNSGVAFTCYSNGASAVTGPWVYYHALVEQ